MTALQQFYSGQRADDQGRKIEEIWAWDDARLESVHDYIQWLFPTRRRSDFNPLAPVLEDEDVVAFHGSRQLRERLLRSFDRILQFYGFELTENESALEVARSSSWPLRRADWLSPGNHNHLRITRILTCLRVLGLSAHSKVFYKALEQVARQHPGQVTARTLDIWRTAAG